MLHNVTVVITDLSLLPAPDELATDVAVTDRRVTVINHRARVPLGWWNQELARRQLPGAPVSGIDEDGNIVGSGIGYISRSDVFALAEAALSDDTGEQMPRHALHRQSGERA